MLSKLITFLIFFSYIGSAFAEDSTTSSIQLFQANWSCPGQKAGKDCGTNQTDGNCILRIPDSAVVDVKISSSGYALIFSPDFLNTGSSNLKLPQATRLYEDCLNRFMHDVSSKINELRSSCTPSPTRPANSTDPDHILETRQTLPAICRLTDTQLETNLFNKFNQNYLVTKNREHIRLVPNRLSQSSNELTTQLGAGTVNIMTDLDNTFRSGESTLRVAEHSKAVADHVDTKLSSLPDEEKRKMLEDFALQYSDYLGDYEEFKKNCGSVDQCREKEQVRAVVLTTLNQLARAVEPTIERASALAEQLCRVPIDTPASSLAEFLEQTTQSLACEALAPSSHRLVPASGFVKSHLMKRSAQGDYVAAFNVNFAYADGAVSGNDMRNRASSCLRAAAPYLTGPDGKKLNIVLMTQAETDQLPSDQRPAKTTITVESLGFRAHSGAYSQDVDCSVIVHEMLHNFGLCDEYEEKTIDDGQAFNCRILTTGPSIMRSHDEAFKAVIPNKVECEMEPIELEWYQRTDDVTKKFLVTETPSNSLADYCSPSPQYLPTDMTAPTYARKYSDFIEENDKFSFVEKRPMPGTPGPGGYAYRVASYKFTNCQCPINNQNCLENKQRVVALQTEELKPATECQGGLKKADFPPSPLGVNVAAAGEVTGVTGNRMKIVNPAIHTSLLRPNHFAKAISMGCEGLANEYNECANLAYKSRSDAACTPELRNKCTEDYFLGTPR